MKTTGFVTMTDAATGAVRVHGRNIITFAGDDLTARVLAGQSEYRPTHIGFVYGANATPAADFADPSDTREHPWAEIRSQVLAAEANILIAPITAAGLSAGDADHGANVAALHSSSGAGFEYAFAHTGGFAVDLPTAGTVYYYQLLLLNRRMVSNSPVYTAFARKAVAKVEGVYVGVDDDDAQMVVWELTISLAAS